MKYTVILEKGRESDYVASVAFRLRKAVAHCPTLKGCVSQGRTKKEALKNLKEAVEAYMECLIEDGLPVPQETGKKFINLTVLVK